MTNMKSVLALAITAALAAPLAAQAEVKLSGKIQAELASTDKGDGDNDRKTDLVGGSGADNGGFNAIAISASEKLGGGLTAIGAVAWSFSTVDSGSFSARHRWLGIKGANGHFKAGRMNSAYKKASLGYDKWKATSLQARDGGGGMSGGNFGHSSYLDNVLEAGFKSNGVKGTLQFLPEDTDVNGGASAIAKDVTESSWLGNISYNTKQWSVGAAVANKANGDGDSLTNWKVYTKATFGSLYVAAQYESVETGVAKMGLSAASGSIDAANYLWGQVGYKVNNLELIGWVAAIDADEADNADALSYAVGAKYNFSKRFNVYGGYRSVDSDNNAIDEDVFLVGGLLKF